ncbi:MAG TPA: hypothetical protein DCP92_15645, partial [Nitrospiraceae bacterium]|nr:hypothetical protein [Nitrospiraceae bacterium]
QMLKHYRPSVVAYGQPYDSRRTPMGYLFGEVVNDSPDVVQMVLGRGLNATEQEGPFPVR